MFQVPNKIKVVRGASPVTTNGGVTADYISMKNVHRAYVVCHMTQAVGHATGIDPVQATAVDGTGAKAFANVLPIWSNEDCAASSTLAIQTAAITYNVAATVKNKIVVFQVDADALDVANDFDVLGVTVDDSSQATNLISIEYWLEMRYPDAEVITD